MTKSTIHRLKHRPLALALSALLLSGVLSLHATAQAFPVVINLSSLDGSNGFRLDGVAAYDYAGQHKPPSDEVSW